MADIKTLKIKVPSDVEWIIKTLTDAGFEAYIVGGCVRDSILGKVPKDWDITTSALPEQVKSLFSNTVDTGIQHGTVMVVKSGIGYEITTYRLDGPYLDCRRPESVTFTPSLAEDLKRRDFTINAFAYNPDKGVVDLFDGISDLNNGYVRCVGNPDERFNEDALRIMRAVRFAAALSFKVEDKTYEAIKKYSQNLANISRERIRVEFEKTLMSNNPEYVNEYKKLGMAQYVIPDYSEKCFDESKSKFYPPCESLSLRLAFFFSNLSPDEAEKNLRVMTFDGRTKKMVCSILDHKNENILPDKKYIKYCLRDWGKEIFEQVLRYREIEASMDDAVYSGNFRCQEMLLGQNLEDIRDIYDEIISRDEAYAISHLAVNGDDLILAGVPKGKAVGEILGNLLDEVIKNPNLNSKEELLNECKRYL